MSIEQNVEQRKSAVECLSLVVECANEFDNAERFWQAMRDGVAAHLPPPVVNPKERPMTVEEATKFGKSIMPFGEFKGQPVGDVPLERLAWYTDQSWGRDASRYLQSPNVAKEFNAESEAKE